MTANRSSDLGWPAASWAHLSTDGWFGSRRPICSIAWPRPACSFACWPRPEPEERGSHRQRRVQCRGVSLGLGRGHPAGRCPQRHRHRRSPGGGAHKAFQKRICELGFDVTITETAGKAAVGGATDLTDREKFDKLGLGRRDDPTVPERWAGYFDPEQHGVVVAGVERQPGRPGRRTPLPRASSCRNPRAGIPGSRSVGHEPPTARRAGADPSGRPAADGVRAASWPGPWRLPSAPSAVVLHPEPPGPARHQLVCLLGILWWGP